MNRNKVFLDVRDISYMIARMLVECGLRSSSCPGYFGNDRSPLFDIS
jgi:hypothetical protein